MELPLFRSGRSRRPSSNMLGTMYA